MSVCVYRYKGVKGNKTVASIKFVDIDERTGSWSKNCVSVQCLNSGSEYYYSRKDIQELFVMKKSVYKIFSFKFKFCSY